MRQKGEVIRKGRYQFMEEYMKEGITVLFLVRNTFLDIRRREISAVSAIALSITGIGFAIVQKPGLLAFFLPVGIGCVFLALSILTEGKLGMGDAWVLIALGTMLELQRYVIVLLTGLLLASVWSVYLMLFRKKKRTEEIPFLPFLLIGYLGGLLIC